MADTNTEWFRCKIDKQRLKQLSQRNDRTPARVTAALRAVFPEVLVIHSERADRGFAYGSRR